MSNVQQQKCPNCTGPLHFDPKTGKMVCEFCDSMFDVETEAVSEEEQLLKEWTEAQEKAKAEAETEKKKGGKGDPKNRNQIEGFDFQSLMHQAETENCEALPIYTCQSCGAEILAANEEFSLTCPFCKNNVVLTDKVSGKLRPDGIIPFQITPDKLKDAVKKYYRGQKYIPKKFFSDNVMGKVTGIYVPFWVFDGDVEGELYYTGEKFRNKHRVGDYIVEEYDVYSLTRKVALSFEGIPVDASDKMDDAMMDSLEPFHMKDVKPFDIRYLAGFAADRFDVAARYIAGRARGRMARTLGEQAERKATAGYSSVRMTGSKLDADLKAKYILMPVYQFDLEYDSKKYSFAVNGQTGKVTGNLPYDSAKAEAVMFLRFALLAAGLIGIMVIRYLMGG